MLFTLICTFPIAPLTGKAAWTGSVATAAVGWPGIKCPWTTGAAVVLRVTTCLAEPGTTTGAAVVVGGAMVTGVAGGCCTRSGLAGTQRPRELFSGVMGT